MKLLKLLDDKLEEYLMVAATVVMTVAIFAQVIMRYIFNNSLAWTEELARYLFIWSVWLGASYGVKTKGHVRLTVITSKLKPAVQNVVAVVVDVMWFAFMVFLVVKGLDLVKTFYVSGSTSTALHLPMWVAYASVPVGCALMCFRMIETGWQTIKERKKEKEAGK